MTEKFFSAYIRYSCSAKNKLGIQIVLFICISKVQLKISPNFFVYKSAPKASDVQKP